jgi:hypothetical protein
MFPHFIRDGRNLMRIVKPVGSRDYNNEVYLIWDKVSRNEYTERYNGTALRYSCCAWRNRWYKTVASKASDTYQNKTWHMLFGMVPAGVAEGALMGDNLMIHMVSPEQANLLSQYSYQFYYDEQGHTFTFNCIGGAVLSWVKKFGHLVPYSDTYCYKAGSKEPKKMSISTPAGLARVARIVIHGVVCQLLRESGVREVDDIGGGNGACHEQYVNCKWNVIDPQSVPKEFPDRHYHVEAFKRPYAKVGLLLFCTDMILQGVSHILSMYDTLYVTKSRNVCGFPDDVSHIYDELQQITIEKSRVTYVLREMGYTFDPTVIYTYLNDHVLLFRSHR